MPGELRPVTPTGVHDHVREHCFSGPAGDRVGVELERLTVRLSDPTSAVDFGSVERAATSSLPLPNASALTFEPAGQVELSTTEPHARPSNACDAVSDDLLAVDATLRDHDFGLVALGLDPSRPPRRTNPKARYCAMESYFGESQPAGHLMMCSTASVQVNVDLGPPERVATRWHLAHRLGPAFAATFANSPALRGPYAGAVGARAAVWHDLDPSRTRPADHAGDPAYDWAEYALDARVMFTLDGGVATPVTTPMTFRAWCEGALGSRRPTTVDLDVHLSTLFPPVRPRGWLELRMIDTLPSPWWRVPVAVAAALLIDSDAGTRAADAVAGLAWADAAHGLAIPRFARAGRAVVAAALDALPGIDADSVDVVSEYAERWTLRDRTPADDRLEAWRRGAPLLDPDADLLGAG